MWKSLVIFLLVAMVAYLVVALPQPQYLGFGGVGKFSQEFAHFTKNFEKIKLRLLIVNCIHCGNAMIFDHKVFT